MSGVVEHSAGLTESVSWTDSDLLSREQSNKGFTFGNDAPPTYLLVMDGTA